MIVCIIQARMGSTRLPRKVLKPILEKPMLQHQIERIKHSQLVNKIVIATTIKPEDDPIFELAQKIGVVCFRGSELDVLDRYYQAAKETHADVVIRITGDCPLSDPVVIDETIEYFLKNSADLDYTSKPANYPEGLDMEIFSFKTLEQAWKEATKPSEREHVTPYIYNHPELFRIRSWKNGEGDFSKMHWSVDTQEDFVFVTKIFEALYPINHFFTKNDVLEFLVKNPDLLSVNLGGTGYEGYAKSLKEDEVFSQKQAFYEKMIGYIPEAIILLSAGTIMEETSDKTISYRSTRVNEGDAFGILWGEARMLATAEIAIFFPKAMVVTTSVRFPDEPTHAKIIRDELEQLSIPRDRIILEEKSTNTLSQIGEVIKIVQEKKFKKVVFITNEYQAIRARAMYEYFETLIPPDPETKRIVRECKKDGVRVLFVSAESILPYRDKKYIEIVNHMKKSPAYINRLKNEEQGTAMVISGEYGKIETNVEDKLEREE